MNFEDSAEARKRCRMAPGMSVSAARHGPIAAVR